MKEELELNKINRRTGKTTKACLNAIAKAYSEPQIAYNINDPDDDDRNMVEHTQRACEELISRMDLKGFTVYIVESQDVRGRSTQSRLYITYDPPLGNLYEDEEGTIYEVKEY